MPLPCHTPAAPPQNKNAALHHCSSYCPHPPKLTHSSSDDPPKRVPGSAVEPVEERVVTIHGHVVRGAIVEPGGEVKQ